MTLSVPPRFVPTLTEIVSPQQPFQSSASPDVAAPVEDFTEAMLQRISKHVNLVLETSLRDSVRNLVSKQMEALTPLLMDEIERLVRDSINRAVEPDASSAQTSEDDRAPG